jgi:aspartate racemase
LSELTDYLVCEVERLAKGDADLALIAANTPHIVFDDVRLRSSIPMVSIVEATREFARAMGLRRVGLFGTRFTMQGRFFPKSSRRPVLRLCRRARTSRHTSTIST